MQLGECNICEPNPNSGTQLVDLAINIAGCVLQVRGGTAIVGAAFHRMNFLNSKPATMAIIIGCASYKWLSYNWDDKHIAEDQRLINAINSIELFKEYGKLHPNTDKRVDTAECLKGEEEIHNFLDKNNREWHICQLPKKPEEVVKTITSIVGFNDFEYRYNELGYHLASPACPDKEEQVHSFIEEQTTLCICLTKVIPHDEL